MKCQLLLIVLILPLLLLQKAAAVQAPLYCDVRGSDDHFILYSHQIIWSGEHYIFYTLMDGLTIAAVHRPSLRYNRLTNLNLHQPGERLQLFSGQCQISESATP
ncbi:hypothetical protein [Marinobacterium jannaschii]|uniref:hypothetical protein n=1 Tax=Marinobacterium jannaschii TaxID=64970 RepID=UPI0004819139|nr:hypothetical protein [Marinobacterium jannaschii]